MNKQVKRNFGKMALTFAIALALIFGMGGISASAKSIQKGAIESYNLTGISHIKGKEALAHTLLGGTGSGTASVSVSSIYSYVNVETLKTRTSSKSNGYYSSCSVSFSAPSNCRSVKITSSHRVAACGQTWTTETSATY